MTGHLTLVAPLPETDPAEPDRSELELLAAGEPVLLETLDLIAFANSDWDGLDPTREPTGYTLAEVMLSGLLQHPVTLAELHRQS